MFGLFDNRKSKLEKKLQRLLKESFELSHVNRKAADSKASEADEVVKQLEALELAQSKQRA